MAPTLTALLGIVVLVLPEAMFTCGPTIQEGYDVPATPAPSPPAIPAPPPVHTEEQNEPDEQDNDGDDDDKPAVPIGPDWTSMGFVVAEHAGAPTYARFANQQPALHQKKMMEWCRSIKTGR